MFRLNLIKRSGLNRNQNGFSVIEMAVVLLVIAIDRDFCGAANPSLTHAGCIGSVSAAATSATDLQARQVSRDYPTTHWLVCSLPNCSESRMSSNDPLGNYLHKTHGSPSQVARLGESPSLPMHQNSAFDGRGVITPMPKKPNHST
jgi:prepilin-type N-terminal cleavage/methylation domain-containing protein